MAAANAVSIIVVLLNPDINGLPAATISSIATLAFISAVVKLFLVTCAASVATVNPVIPSLGLPVKRFISALAP